MVSHSSKHSYRVFKENIYIYSELFGNTIFKLDKATEVKLQINSFCEVAMSSKDNSSEFLRHNIGFFLSIKSTSQIPSQLTISDITLITLLMG